MRVVAGAQRERAAAATADRLDQLLRLLLLIEVVLQPPALQPRAAVGEHRDDVARFDADVALRRVADERRPPAALQASRRASLRSPAQRRLPLTDAAAGAADVAAAVAAGPATGFGTGFTNSACHA